VAWLKSLNNQTALIKQENEMTESSTVNSSADTPNLATLPGGPSELHSPLLDCLVIYSKLNRQPTSKDALISGLPTKEGKITP